MSRIIKRPVLTEKSLQEASQGKYTFIVDLKAGKKTVADAVQQAFKVSVLSVRTRILKGKRIRIRGTRLQKLGSKLKKATVQVAPGQKISDFETA